MSGRIGGDLAQRGDAAAVWCTRKSNYLEGRTHRPAVMLMMVSRRGTAYTFC